MRPTCRCASDLGQCIGTRLPQRGTALSKFSHMLSLFSRVFARDPNEKAKLLSVLDRRSTVPDLIRVVPDTAWLLELDCKAKGREIFYVTVEYSSTTTDRRDRI